jgi:hypothetical protein
MIWPDGWLWTWILLVSVGYVLTFMYVTEAAVFI